MKIAAVIDEFNELTDSHKKLIRQIREQSKADFIIAIMSGNFLQQGIPALSDKYIRASHAVSAGIDLVIELPVYCTLSSPDTYAYAAISALENLHCINELYIPCTADTPSILSDVARFLFMESREYQLRVKQYRSKGISFYDAQAQAVGHYIPEAAEILKNPLNIFAAEYGRALKRIYSMITPVYINIPGLTPSSHPRSDKTDWTYLSSLLNYELLMHHRNMDEIYGGTSALTDSICRLKHTYDNFNGFSEKLKTPTRSHANIRRYMLNYILNIRKSDMAICRLYNFAPYFRIIGHTPSSAHLLSYLHECTRTPVFVSTSDSWTSETENQILYKCDPIIPMMAAFDSRAHKLYKLAFPDQ